MHPPLQGADVNINSTQSANVNVNAEVLSAASADANIKCMGNICYISIMNVLSLLEKVAQPISC